jgi:hypothetical protein
VAGGVALLVWSVVAWTLLPLHRSSLRRIEAEDRVVAALVEAGTPGGVYVIPGVPTAPGGSKEAAAAAMSDWEARASRGPLATLAYRPVGRAPGRMFRPIARGLALAVAAALFSAWALSRTRITVFLGRAAFVAGMGLFAWILGPAMQWNWFAYPAGYTTAVLLDALIGWAIVGIVQAGIVRAAPATSAAA